MALSLKPMTTTLIGGVVFLLPLIVALAVLGQGLALMAGVAQPVAAMFPNRQVSGVALVSLVALLLLLMLCYGAGLLARAALGRTLSASFEDRLQALYPRYTIIKGMTQGLGVDGVKSGLKTVLVSFDDHQVLSRRGGTSGRRPGGGIPAWCARPLVRQRGDGVAGAGGERAGGNRGTAPQLEEHRPRQRGAVERRIGLCARPPKRTGSRRIGASTAVPRASTAIELGADTTIEAKALVERESAAHEEWLGHVGIARSYGCMGMDSGLGLAQPIRPLRYQSTTPVA